MLKLALLYVEAFPSLYWSPFFFMLKPSLAYLEAFSSLSERRLFFIPSPPSRILNPFSCLSWIIVAVILQPLSPAAWRQSSDLLGAVLFIPKPMHVCWCLFSMIIGFDYATDTHTHKNTHTQITKRDAQTSAKNATSERMCVHKINFESKCAVKGKYRASITLAQDNES